MKWFKSIGQLAERIERDLNKDEMGQKYKVSTVSGTPGAVRITDVKTSNSRSFRLKYRKVPRNRTVFEPWDSSYEVGRDGKVFLNGKHVGWARFKPLHPNKESTARQYMYAGFVNASPDSWIEIDEHSIDDVKDMLS